ncbi:MAG: hypothetical protein WCP65_05475, partial [Bacteroidota bacterium]
MKTLLRTYATMVAFILLMIFCFCEGAKAQIITTVAGGGVGDGMPALQAYKGLGEKIVIDAAGNLIVSQHSFRIRKISTGGIVTTIAGLNAGGYSGDGGLATLAKIGVAPNVCIDASGNIYFADQTNQRIRKISTSGIITTVAGNGTTGFSGDGGAATVAQLYNPSDVAVDGSGNLYIADNFNHRIRMVNTSGIISTVAGTSTGGYSGDGGDPLLAKINANNIAVDANGNLYFADGSNNRIRKISTSNIITTIAGNGTAGFSGDGGVATSAKVSGPLNVTIDGSGNLYIADGGNARIRKVNTSGIISTVAGYGVAGFGGDGGSAIQAVIGSNLKIAVDIAGALYISDGDNGRIRKVGTNGIINTIAGNGEVGYSGDGDAATNESLYRPNNLTIDRAGNLYIADQSNGRIRKVNTGGIISTVAGNGSSVYVEGIAATSVGINPNNVVVDTAGNLYITDGNYVRKVDKNGIITTVVGNGNFSPASGDEGAALSASLVATYVAIDATGNLYIADSWNNQIRKVSVNGIISTVAGNGTAGFGGDGGAATSANLNYPTGVYVDNSGNIYIADQYNARIRKVNTSGIISTIAGNGTSAFSGDGAAATAASLNSPTCVFGDGNGNIYIGDQSNNRIRVVNSIGIISTVAGDGISTFKGDGGIATLASFNSPTGVVTDASGNVYIADGGNNRVRKVAMPASISSFSPTNGCAGTLVTIKGIGFIGASAVSFGGVAASSYNVVNDSIITAVVGNGVNGI